MVGVFCWTIESSWMCCGQRGQSSKYPPPVAIISGFAVFVFFTIAIVFGIPRGVFGQRQQLPKKIKKELPKKVLQVSRRGPSKRKKQNWKGLKGCDECDKQRALRVPARKWCGAKEKSNPKESTSRRLRPASASRLVVGSETKMKGKKKRTETRVPIWAELKLGKTRNERSSIWISIMKYVDFMD